MGYAEQTFVPIERTKVEIRDAAGQERVRRDRDALG